jgi:hypothetical protein
MSQASEHPYLCISPQVTTTLVTDNDDISVPSVPSLWSPRDSTNDDFLDSEDFSAPLPHDTAPEDMSDITPPEQSIVQGSRYSVRQVAVDTQSMQYYMSTYGRLSIFGDDRAQHSLFAPLNA